MSENTQNYAIFLDDLRIQCDISVDDLVEGICTDRQYRKYLSGENTLLTTKLIAFCEKLNISPTEFFYSYASNEDEYKKLYILYIEAQKSDFDTLMNMCKNIDSNSFQNQQNIRFLNLIIEIAKYHNKKIHINASHDNFSKLIDYPKCLNKKRFDYIDIIALSYLGNIESKFKKSKAVDKMLEILNNTLMLNLSFGSRQLIPSIYGNVCTYLYNLDRFEEGLDIARKGISHSTTYNDFSSMHRFRYIISLCLRRLGLINEAEIEAVKCYISSLILENDYITKQYTKKIKKHFNTSPIDLLIKHRLSFPDK